jgi:hypothetical protein
MGKATLSLDRRTIHRDWAISMHPRTVATLQELSEAHWFARVGVKDTDAASVLSSWAEAIRHCSSPGWEDLCLEAVNQYCERLLEKSKDRYNQWNDIVDEIKPVTAPFVRDKIAVVVRDNALPQVFEDTVQWDILHVCMEAEFADVFPPGYYASQAYWYMKGHFPCGWMGRFPQGKLIVY